ncbi:MAG: glycoside hydrolase family 10 protein [Prochloraceae cyanobacterium]
MVRTEENVRKSQGINNCWQEIELDECILDISSWSQDSDLGNTSVLSLPNVEKLNRFQLLALQNKSRVTSAKLLAMGKELETLIDRFESTLITAEANSSRINLSTGKIIEQLLRNSEQAGDKDSSHNLASLESEFSNTDARQALTEARKRLEKFYQLIDRQKYNQAKQEWLQTRRLLWDSYPTDRKIAQAEIRAIWLDRGTIVKAKSESDLAKIFDRLAAAGINTVFFETVNASYTIYPSKIAPEQNPLVKGWDPLKSAVKLAHARGMELHAWVWIFAAANQAHNTILQQPTNYLGPVLSAHPDWAMSDRQGRIFHPKSNKAFFDPANPQVKRYLLALLEEIATRYRVDGIQLDYIRYPFQKPRYNQTYGYSKVSRQLFKQKTSVDPITMDFRHPLWFEWTEFRIQQIDNFVTSAYQLLKSKRPNLIVSAAVFSYPQRYRISRLQQNWEEWAHQGLIDMIVPMTYSGNTSELEQMTEYLFSKYLKGGTLLLPSIRLLNLPDMLVVDKVQLLRDLPSGGYALFAVENFNPNLGQILSRTQGSVQSSKKEPLPHRQPFQATLARYQGLQREWGLILAKNQFSIDKQAMKEWGKRSDLLATSLTRLKNKPSMRNLLSAQIALSSFRRQFPNWMQQQKEMHPYQVQAWENRLETLDRLLSYGERQVLNRNRANVAER